MKRTLTIVVLAVLAVIMIASPVLATGSGSIREVAKRTPTVISMTAKILKDSVDEITDTGDFYVAIQMTNRAFIEYRGTQDTVIIDDSTVCLEWVNQKKSILIDCSDVNFGDKISVNARIDSSKTITAKRVWLKQRRIPLP